NIVKPFAPGADIGALVDELTERTEAELDYRYEAANQRTFAKSFGDDPNFMIPKVIASSPKVLVTQWVDGTPLREVIASGPQTERDTAAA
ncbi:AarF/UbiB family protein, partial [Mycobacterium kansasii]